MSGSKRKGDLGKSRAALTDNSPKQRVLAAGEWYIGGDSAWHPDLLQVGDIIEFPVYDDHSKEQGNLIVRVDVKFKEDRHGRAFDATALACSHKGFRTFMEKQLQKKTCRFHFCRTDGSECEWETQLVHNFLHVDAFTRLKEAAARKKIAVWTSDKKKTFDICDSVSVDASEAEEPEPPSRSGTKTGQPQSKLRKDPAADDEVLVSEEEEDDRPPLQRRKTDSSAEARARSGLDDALGALDSDRPPAESNAAATSSRPNKEQMSRVAVDEKLAELRERLMGRGLTSVKAANASALAARATKRCTTTIEGLL